ncbi:MAG: hypothetical protein WCK58_13560 [Chloroflexota bacterium]
MPAVRRPRTMVTVLAAVVVSMSLSACGAWTTVPVDELFASPSATPAPAGSSASGTPAVVTPDPSVEMAVDAPVTLFTNANPDGVTPGATVPSTFTVGAEPVHVTAVVTYHYVLPAGVPATGTVSLRGPGGAVYGPWATTGSEGQGGIANASWQADVDLILAAGTYTIVDSDPATWSANSRTGGSGMFWVNGTATTP